MTFHACVFLINLYTPTQALFVTSHTGSADGSTRSIDSNSNSGLRLKDILSISEYRHRPGARAYYRHTYMSIPQSGTIWRRLFETRLNQKMV
jgi:hypothetical protein